VPQADGLGMAAGVPDTVMAPRSLAAHNAERASLSLPPLRWNCHLEQDASEWAQALLRQGALAHADAGTRKGIGENLWMGTSGRWPLEQMIGRFIEEKQQYRHGRFPDVSVTGNGADVGHYSQIVWRDTREVGCALARDSARDVLVCRYYPAGNVQGRVPF